MFKHSSIHAISKVTPNIYWIRNASYGVRLVFIDLEGAFNLFCLDGPFFNLTERNFLAK